MKEEQVQRAQEMTFLHRSAMGWIAYLKKYLISVWNIKYLVAWVSRPVMSGF